MNRAQQLHQQQQQPSTTLLYNSAGQPVAISLPPQTSDYELYKSKQSKVSGVILIFNGVLFIILNGFGIGLREIGTYAGHGFWGGVLVSKLSYKLYFLCYKLCILQSAY